MLEHHNLSAYEPRTYIGFRSEDAHVPALDDLSHTNKELQRLSAVNARVKLGAVKQAASVVGTARQN